MDKRRRAPVAPARAVLVSVLAVMVATATAAQRAPKPATPVDAVDGLIRAFRSHHVVVFNEFHDSEAQHTFLRSLIRDPRFTAVVDDLVIEFGNALYQDVVDRWVRGENVSEVSVQRAWNYTTVGKGAWGRTGIYPNLYREVRAVNATLPEERRLRIVLGDPPIDWERPDLGGFVLKPNGIQAEWPTSDERYNRDFHPASVIRNEVLAKNRRALVIYGQGHTMRGSYSNIVGLLEERFKTKVFVVIAPTNHALEAAQPSITGWPIPSLSLIRGTVLGRLDAGLFLKARALEHSAERHYDAVIYLGPTTSLANRAPSQ
jgi:hypothetical protein